MLELAESETEVRRRLTMRDGMILVAAAAVAFGFDRVILEGVPTAPTLSNHVWYAVLAGCSALAPVSLFLRLFRPRPDLAELCRRPGFVACLAVSTVITLGLVATGIIAVIRLAGSEGWVPAFLPVPKPNPSWWLRIAGIFLADIGPSVIACTLLLALSGRRRPSGDWLDNLGRLVGALWIVLFVHRCYLSLGMLTY